MWCSHLLPCSRLNHIILCVNTPWGCQQHGPPAVPQCHNIIWTFLHHLIELVIPTTETDGLQTTRSRLSQAEICNYRWRKMGWDWTRSCGPSERGAAWRGTERRQWLTRSQPRRLSWLCLLEANVWLNAQVPEATKQTKKNGHIKISPFPGKFCGHSHPNSLPRQSVPRYNHWCCSFRQKIAFCWR